MPVRWRTEGFSSFVRSADLCSTETASGQYMGRYLTWLRRATQAALLNRSRARTRVRILYVQHAPIRTRIHSAVRFRRIRT